MKEELFSLKLNKNIHGMNIQEVVRDSIQAAPIAALDVIKNAKDDASVPLHSMALGTFAGELLCVAISVPCIERCDTLEEFQKQFEEGLSLACKAIRHSAMENAKQLIGKDFGKE